MSNVIRREESKWISLDESRIKVKPTSVLEAKLKDVFLSEVKDCQMILDNFDKCFYFDAQYPDNTSEIFGTVDLTMVLEVSKHDASYFTNLFSRYAWQLGYNYVDHSVSDVERIKDEKSGKLKYVLQRLEIQFEAIYIEDTTLPLGRYLYHLTPKSMLSRVMRQGLVPSSKCKQGFNYPPRIYCFICRDRELERQFAKNTEKKSIVFANKEELDSKVKHYWIKLADELQKSKDIGLLFDSREFVLLQIDTKKLPTGFKFYRDSLFEIDGEFKAVYTDQGIPPSALEVVDEIKLDA